MLFIAAGAINESIRHPLTREGAKERMCYLIKGYNLERDQSQSPIILYPSRHDPSTDVAGGPTRCPNWTSHKKDERDTEGCQAYPQWNGNEDGTSNKFRTSLIITKIATVGEAVSSINHRDSRAERTARAALVEVLTAWNLRNVGTVGYPQKPPTRPFSPTPPSPSSA
jgi:hypothetical protein